MSSTPFAIKRLFYWLTNDPRFHRELDTTADKIDWFRAVPYAALHLACLAVFWVGFNWWALGIAVLFYFVRMFFITGFYHRYFSHRTFRTSRPMQFVMGFLGTTAGQRGPLWWAAHHRHHHGNSDGEEDHHSPGRRGFLWSHTLWFLSKRNFQTPVSYIPDWLRFKELVWLDRLDWLPFLLFGAGVYGLGVGLETWVPQTGVDRLQVFVWGFLVSTVLLYHGTYTINSLSHQFGRRRFPTEDDSRNNWFLALLTMGEGWHNNHHYYPSAARQGFFWWEIDITYYLIRLFGELGLLWDLRPVPAKVLNQWRQSQVPGKSESGT